jgi:hypothetical protein
MIFYLEYKRIVLVKVGPSLEQLGPILTNTIITNLSRWVLTKPSNLTLLISTRVILDVIHIS